MKKFAVTGLKHITLIAISIIMIFPLLWMILGGLKTSQEAMNPEMILPDVIHLENVIDVFKNSPLMKYIGNSLTVAIIATLIQIVTGAMLAYAFSFIRFKGRNVLFHKY